MKLFSNQLAKIFSILVIMMLAACDAQSDKADKVFYTKKIYTVNENMPFADVVAVRGGRIIYVGSKDGADEYIDDATEIVDLPDSYLYPGFTDAHAHMRGIGWREMSLNLEGVGSITELRALVGDAVSKKAEGELVYGRGWIETHWPEGRFPNKADLDDISPNNPVIITRADGHALVANSKAMAVMGITKETPSADGGEIHYGADGNPNGFFVDNDQALFEGLTSNYTTEDIIKAYEIASRVYNAYGWTGMHNMSVAPADVALIEHLSDAKQISLRVYNSIDLLGDDNVINTQAVNQLIDDGKRKSKNGQVITRAIKIYMDGALGSRGAALLAPYADGNSVGLLRTKKEDVLPVLINALRAGIQINTHAIGDRGNRLLLDWYEEAFKAVPPEERAIADPRWRNEHSQIIEPSDIPRFASLGVIPSMQPSHAIGDLYFAPSRLGKDRLVGAYPWQSLIDSGSIILGGSDAPVERGDPRIEFYAAVARMSLDGFYNDDWHREEAVSREDALKMFTLWPAYGSFQEADLGSIEVGKLADFTVFSDDIMVIDFPEILKVDTIMTVVEGNIVYSKAAQ